jgi:hypothetical protein
MGCAQPKAKPTPPALANNPKQPLNNIQNPQNPAVSGVNTQPA